MENMERETGLEPATSSFRKWANGGFLEGAGLEPFGTLSLMTRLQRALVNIVPPWNGLASV